ncbi:MAG TPA: TlpA disulfide reductase family protein [Acidimicrobiales bacterium]|nr:TlpA disulfide reductase family protein [Acidimicrobiales bacterium]
MTSSTPDDASSGPEPPEPTPSSSGSGRNPRRRRLLALGIGIVVAVGLALGFFLAPASTPAVAAFSLPRLGGGSNVSYPAKGSGSDSDPATVVTFFASWCTPCHRDLPVIAKFVDTTGRTEHGVRFVGVDGDDAPGSGLAFARASGVTFPVGSDRDETVATHLGLAGLPDTVFIDASGHVVHVIQGPASETALKEWTAKIAS